MKKCKKIFVTALAFTMMLPFNLSAVYASNTSSGRGTYFAETGGTGGIIFNNNMPSSRFIMIAGDWTPNLNFSYVSGRETLHGVWSHRNLYRDLHGVEVENGLGSRVRATTVNTEGRAWVQNGTATSATTGQWRPAGNFAGSNHTSEASAPATSRGSNRAGWGIRFR